MSKIKEFAKKNKTPLMVGVIALILLVLAIPTAYNVGKDDGVKKITSLQNQDNFYEPFSDDPFVRMEQMHQRMESLFDDVWADPFATYGFDFPTATFPMTITDFGNFQRASFDYYTEDDEIVIKADLPIEEEAEVDVSITEQGVTIKSVQESKTGMSTTEGQVEEYRNQQFYRYLALPENADTEKVKQTFKDGKMEIRIPIENMEVND